MASGPRPPGNALDKIAGFVVFGKHGLRSLKQILSRQEASGDAPRARRAPAHRPYQSQLRAAHAVKINPHFIASTLSSAVCTTASSKSSSGRLAVPSRITPPSWHHAPHATGDLLFPY